MQATAVACPFISVGEVSKLNDDNLAWAAAACAEFALTDSIISGLSASGPQLGLGAQGYANAWRAEVHNVNTGDPTCTLPCRYSHAPCT